MKAIKLVVLSALMAILLVAPGYAATTHYGSANHSAVLSHSDAHGTYEPVHERTYHNGYGWGHERYWRGDGYRPYGYYHRPYGYDYGYYGPYYYRPYASFSLVPGFSVYFGF